MGDLSRWAAFKLCFGLILSMHLWVSDAAAHEVTPTIGDVSVEGGALTLALRLNAEALLAGIDLDGLDDTDNSEGGASYDALRALPPEDLTAQFTRFAEGWAKEIGLDAGGPAAFTVAAFQPGSEADLRLARVSELVLTAEIPALAREMVLNWPAGAGALILRQQGVDDPFTGYLSGGETSPPIPLDGGVETTGWQVFVDYIPVGFAHIVPMGLDHILFVLGLFFLGTATHTLLWQISAFTLAHTVTLALGAVGWVQVPASVVEPLIAASITYVAVENIWLGHLTRWRPVVIFVFGLLHGLGFASVLGEFGLPRAQFFPALIGFNIGVEFGQLSVIAFAFLAVGFWFGGKSWYRQRIAIPASAVIALIGAWWVVERVFL